MTARTKLLRTQVGKLEPQAKPYRVYDLEVPALCVEVRPSGRKVYVLAYRLPGGRAGRYREMRLGTHPGLVPEKARELALGHLAKLVEGLDPVEALREARKPVVEPLTVAEAVEKYVEALAGRPGQKAPKSALNVYIRPWKHAGDPATELRTAQVRSLLAQITERHTAKLRAGGHVVSALREAFRYCREHDLIPKGEDPTAGVTIHTGKRVRRIASAEEMALVVAAVRSEWQAGQLWPPTLGLIMLLMATGARPNELRTAKLSDLDRRRGVLVLEKHKTSSTSGAREIALSPAALAILDMVPTVSGNPYLLPGKLQGKPIANYSITWARLRKRAGLPDDLTPYSFRRTFGTIARSAASLEAASDMLGHADLATTRDHYAIMSLEQRRELAGRIGSLMGLEPAVRASGPDGPVDT